MIRTKKEYQGAKATLEGLRNGVQAQRAEFERLGLGAVEVERALQPMEGFIGQVEAEMAQYDRWRQGQIEPAADLAHVGQLLIGLRIVRGWSQRELAARLGVSEAQVSRDERSEYHAITVDRAQRILDVLGVQVTLGVHEPPASSPSIEQAAGAR